MKTEEIKAILVVMMKDLEHNLNQCRHVMTLLVSEDLGDNCELVLESEQPAPDQARAVWRAALKDGWTNEALHELCGAVFRGKPPQELTQKEVQALAREIKKAGR